MFFFHILAGRNDITSAYLAHSPDRDFSTSSARFKIITTQIAFRIMQNVTIFRQGDEKP
jgi:hypothetical protein